MPGTDLPVSTSAADRRRSAGTRHLVAQRDGVDCNLALIPHTFDARHAEEFGTAYMRQLYELAGTMAAGGYPPEKQLPDCCALAEQSRTPPRGATPTS
jgi:hypothetical protein